MTTSTTPITRTLSETITTTLERDIVNGVFKPGESLPPERKLANDLGVSRSSLRQALSALEARGLIQSRQGGGNYVCNIAKKSFTDPLQDLMKRHRELKFQIIELRQTLECAAAELAAQRATGSDKREIRKKLEALERVIPKQDPQQEAKADLALHLAIVDAAHNAPMALMVRNIYALLLNEVQENLTIMQKIETCNAQLHRQHIKMAECVINGDSEGASQAMLQHMQLIEDTYVKNGILSNHQKVADVSNYFSTQQ